MKTAILSLLITLALAVAGAYYLEQYQHFTLQTQQTLANLETKINTIDADLKSTSNRFESKLQDVKQDEHWKISEVIYLLRLSIEQLKGSQDPQTSLRLLQAADEQLKSIQDPSLLPIREMIQKDRQTLESIKFPNIDDLWLQVGLMIKKVTSLPTRGVKFDSSKALESNALEPGQNPPKQSATQPSNAEMQNKTQISSTVPVNESANPNESNDTMKEHSWKENFKQSLIKLKDLVKIRRHTQPIEPLLPEYEQALARENLRLILEQLRWAILNRQNQLYQNLLIEADQSLDAYFDIADETVKNMRVSLQTMKNIDLQPTLPEIGQALKLLQKR